jgi:hypothetical protein
MTNEHMLNEIKRIHNEYGSVTKVLLQKHASVSYDSIKRRFGSMAAALAEVDIEPLQGQRKMITKEEVIDDLDRVYGELGSMSKPLYEKHGKFTPKVVQRVFSSFSKMMTEMGFTQHPSGYIPTELELVDELKRLSEEHGLVTAAIIRNFGKYSTTTYHERFTSLNLAYESAGLPTRQPGACAHADWVIRRFAKSVGEAPEMEHRFNWLRNPRTNRVLPVDGYFPKAGIIIEYNGPQHYNVDNHYVKTQEALDYRKALDQLKYDLIRKQGLKLIVIDYRDSFTQDYIDNCLA